MADSTAVRPSLTATPTHNTDTSTTLLDEGKCPDLAANVYPFTNNPC